MFKDYQPDLVMNDPVVKDIAKKYNKNVGQVWSQYHTICHAADAVVVPACIWVTCAIGLLCCMIHVSIKLDCIPGIPMLVD